RGYIVIQPTFGDSLSLMTAEERRQFNSAAELVNSPRTARHWRDRPLDVKAVMDALQAEQAAMPPDMPTGVERRSIRYEPPIEPERQEVFLAGTGQEVIPLAQGLERPIHIEGPGNGAVLALDPDIPAERQKVSFRTVPPPGGAQLAGGWPVPRSGLDARERQPALAAPQRRPPD
ncbi:MAG: hypothetical protein HC829_02185, partial [Bacteroidales bacterium]|nr:hypothetical protein [Bacteroidales bacterium]